MSIDCLIDSLKVLKESAQESVENIDSFSTFKEYMHVERDIEKDLTKLLSHIKDSNKGHLILLSGSVGDGKSHLISKLKNKQPELLNNFKIHNDASESFRPEGTSIETLNELLIPFSDELIEQSKENIILAINLGVLNNFINSSFAQDRYKMLRDYINESNVFNSDTETKQWSLDEHFHIVSFGDYQLFELHDGGPKSAYLEQLLNKLTNKTEDNPFYNSYVNTCNSNCPFSSVCPIKKNYEMLMDDEVKHGLISLLIEAIVKEKLIISTRSLLNFLYEIIVSPVFDQLSSDERTKLFSSSKYKGIYIKSLLTMLLYEHKDRSFILKALQMIDPVHQRNQEIDQLLTRLNTSYRPLDVLKELITPDQEILKQIELILEGKKLEVLDLFKYIVRTQKFATEKNLLEFKDPVYDSYMQCLYYYQTGNRIALRNLYIKIEDAIRNWYGSINDEYIYLPGDFGEFIMGQRLEIGYDTSNIQDRSNITSYFSTNIELKYKRKLGEPLSVSLILDYSLYHLLVKVADGYRPNKKDKSNYLQFSDFYDRLMRLGERDKQLKIENKYQDSFKLEYDEDFGFMFERVQ
ncbi:MAG: DNA phosphorothioation-dependent restriction protein DptF [Bacillus sp. (in: firmicutes)]